MKKRDELKMEEGKYILIGLYKEIWDEKVKKNKRKFCKKNLKIK